MDFNIKTAYDIGDLVYTAEFYEGYTPNGPCTITGIDIEISAEKTKIGYCLTKGDTFIGYVLEDRLFTTCAECTEWCKKHN